jgi:hypothetical protein
VLRGRCPKEAISATRSLARASSPNASFAQPKKRATWKKRRKIGQVTARQLPVILPNSKKILYNQPITISLQRGTVLDEVLTPGVGSGREQSWKDGR